MSLLLLYQLAITHSCHHCGHQCDCCVYAGIRDPRRSDRTVPCIYALLQHKNQEVYETLLQVIDAHASRLSPPLSLDPNVVIVDFESAAIAAVRQTFGSTTELHGCFYHLTQATWRKVQALGLAVAYKTDDDLRLFCGMLDELAFLPVTDVADGMVWLRSIAPANAIHLVEYFDETYINGSSRNMQTSSGENRVRQTPPRFPPALWNVNAATLDNGHRTNNVAEGWNNRLRNLVGHCHPSVLALIEALQADAAEASATVLKHAVGNLVSPTRSRAARKLQERLRRLCEEYAAGVRELAQFLRAVGHCVRFVCE